MGFGLNVRTLRKNKGMTKEQLAEQCGVSTLTIARWECGTVPRYCEINKLAHCLETTAESLLKDSKTKDDLETMMANLEYAFLHQCQIVEDMNATETPDVFRYYAKGQRDGLEQAIKTICRVKERSSEYEVS